VRSIGRVCGAPNNIDWSPEDMADPQPDREFSERVTEFVAIDDQLKAAAGPTKELRDRCKELRGWIAASMDEQGYTEVKIKRGTEVLRVSERKVKPRVNADVIRDRFARYVRKCKAEHRGVVAEAMYEWVYGKEGAAREEAADEEPEFELVLSRKALKEPKAKKQPAPKRQKRVVELPCGERVAVVPADCDEATAEERAMAMDS